jgi:hypothetical protein
MTSSSPIDYSKYVPHNPTVIQGSAGQLNHSLISNMSWAGNVVMHCGMDSITSSTHDSRLGDIM